MLEVIGVAVLVGIFALLSRQQASAQTYRARIGRPSPGSVRRLLKGGPRQPPPPPPKSPADAAQQLGARNGMSAEQIAQVYTEALRIIEDRTGTAYEEARAWWPMLAVDVSFLPGGSWAEREDFWIACAAVRHAYDLEQIGGPTAGCSEWRVAWEALTRAVSLSRPSYRSDVTAALAPMLGALAGLCVEQPAAAYH